jgi:hypothetical protein
VEGDLISGAEDEDVIAFLTFIVKSLVLLPCDPRELSTV